MNVVNIKEYRCKDMVAALERLLSAAKAGDLVGLAACAKDTTGREHIVFSGEYQSDPARGVNAANRMSWRLTQLQDERDFNQGGFQ